MSQHEVIDDQILLKWLRKRFVNNIDIEEKKKQQDHRFEFLDAYRGSLILIIVIAQAKEGIDMVFLNGIENIAQMYSIAGFFLLSSFLLTYRMLIELHKPKSMVSFTVSVYAIRRFFRVYLIFVGFAFIARYGPRIFTGKTFGLYEDFGSMIMLEYSGLNHLWTISPEVKFYFLIPVICICFYYSKRFAPLLLVACVLWTLLDQFFNVLVVDAEEIYNFSRECINLKNHIAVFLLGSELGMGFFLAERSEGFMNFVRNRRTQMFMKYFSLLLVLCGFFLRAETYDFNYRSRSAVFWSLIIFMALLSENSSNSFIVRFFNHIDFFKNCGKYSFGMYLWHPAVIESVLNVKILFDLRLNIILTVLISYFLGYLFYYCVQKPLLKLSDYICDKLEYSRFFKQGQHLVFIQ